MEHIIITTLQDGMLRLTPKAGYALLNIITQRRYSEAEVNESDARNFKAVKA